LLGDGGSSQVWRADAGGRIIALKMLKPELRDRAGARACLQREHDLLRELAHPSLVTAVGVVDFGGYPALALEYLPGGDLVPLLGSHPRHWLRALHDVCVALAHVHACGFVHRDLKARNVLFDSRGRARLVDFASALQIGAIAQHAGATAAHRPPGSAAGPVSPDDDCYALAALLYELLSGQLPYGRVPDPASAGAVPPWPLADADDAVSRRIAEVACAALASSGRSPRGLTAIADVLESAVAGPR
jgi:serine/threonine-protein kinase